MKPIRIDQLDDKRFLEVHEEGVGYDDEVTDISVHKHRGHSDSSKSDKDIYCKPAESFTIVPEISEVSAGDTIKFVAVADSSEDNLAPTNPRVVWESSNWDVACISADGVLFAAKDGEVEITATDADRPEISVSKSLTISSSESEGGDEPGGDEPGGDEPGDDPVDPDQPAEPVETVASWEYIHDEASWNESYANGILKRYYEENPSEDLWNTATNSAPGFNDKVYTVKMWTNAECSGDYEVREFKAQYYSDGQGAKRGTQQIIDVNDNEIVYFIPLFFDTPDEVFECFSNVEGGYNGTEENLIGSCSRWIKVDSVSYGGPDVHPSWQGAINAPGAKYPHCDVDIPEGFTGVIRFNYDGGEDIYPWGSEPREFGSYGIVSIPVELGEEFLLVNGETSFDPSKLVVTLVASAE